MDYIMPNYNREYSGSALGDIPNLQLYSYSDAAFINAADRKLTSSYIYKLMGGLVLYKLSKQLIFTTSTTEAEYIVIMYAVKEAL